MDEILEHFLCNFLKKNGFEIVERKALLILKEALISRIESYFRCMNSYKTLGLKQGSTAIDALNLVKQEKESNLKMLEQGELVTYEEPQVEIKPEFISPLANTVERYIHIYDFMPTFPPTHTFKQTYLKLDTKENKSFSVKNRLEQSLRSEGNLLKLMKSSESLPPFINYLYKRNRYN
jgi:hypothetical protein